ncbi:MAG: hypothetical protein HQK52_21445 [Oligoflexia bacterium]|nr:hypothetical protein [Oligoflexia bacterium]
MKVSKIVPCSYLSLLMLVIMMLFPMASAYSSIWGSKRDLILDKFIENNFNFTAYLIAKKMIKKGSFDESFWSIEMVRAFESLPLSLYTPGLNSNSNNFSKLSPMMMVNAQAMAANHQYTLAAKELAKINSDQNYYIESLYLQAMYLHMDGKYTDADRIFRLGHRESKKRDANWLHDKNYISIHQNKILHTYAQMLFEMKNFKAARDVMESIPKKQSIWPTTLIDLAWTEYHLKNYGRSLGLLVTYNSPFLKNYVYPEASYLKALIFYELCYVEQAEQNIEFFEKNIAALAKRLLPGLRQSLDYRKIVMDNDIRIRRKYSDLYTVLVRQNKSLKFLTYSNAIAMIKKEIGAIKNSDMSAINKKLIVDQLLGVEMLLNKDINNYLRGQLERFIRDTAKVEGYFVKLKLALSSKKRKEILLTASDPDEAIISALSAIEGRKRKAFWKFLGAFWADELGDYNYALTSKCK